MSLRIILAASAVLAFAAPALAQEAPVAAATPPAAEAPSAEFMAALARVEAAGEAMEVIMADLEPRAAAVRGDTALSEADKAARIRAMLAGHQPVVDTFSAALSELIRLSFISEGVSPQQAADAAAAARAEAMSIFETVLITGDDGDDGDGHAGHGH